MPRIDMILSLLITEVTDAERTILIRNFIEKKY